MLLGAVELGVAKGAAQVAGVPVPNTCYRQDLIRIGRSLSRRDARGAGEREKKKNGRTVAVRVRTPQVVESRVSPYGVAGRCSSTPGFLPPVVDSSRTA